VPKNRKYSGDIKRKIRVLRKTTQPKKVKLSGKFCKYGRIHSERDIASTLGEESTFIVPIGGNRNNNWRI